MQAFGLRKLRILNVTASLLRLVKFLHNPTAFIPADNIPSMGKRDDRMIGEEKPLQRLHALRWVGLPNANDPDRQRLISMPTPFFVGRAQPNRCGADMQDGFSRLSIDDRSLVGFALSGFQVF